MASWVVALGALLGPSALAVPWPDPYDAGGHSFAEVQRALRDQQWRDALVALERQALEAPEVVDGAEFHNLMGYTLRQLGPAYLNRAIGHYERALDINPAYVPAHEYLGQARLQQGRPDLAQAQLDRIEQLCGNRTCDAWTSLNRAMMPAAARH